ncbi:MAG: hypothetical protein NT071_02225 [Burkholderiales bacterium]|nr:hypothetical protein [Burkholderiales bacterium]
MNPTLHLRLALLLPWVAAPALAQDAVSLQRQDQTIIAALAYAPTAGACRGVALVSPGAGGSETGYGYLGEALAGLGYLAVVVERQVAGRD